MTYTSNMLAGLKYSSDHFPTIIVNDGSVKTIQEAESWVKENISSFIKDLSEEGSENIRHSYVRCKKEEPLTV